MRIGHKQSSGFACRNIPQSAPSSDVAIEEAKLKVTRSKQALEAVGDSSGAKVGGLQRGSTGTSFGGADQASRREVGGRQGGRGARLSRLEQQTMVPPTFHPPSRVAELEQQINALVQERDAFQAVATPKKRSPVTPRPHRVRKRHSHALPNAMQDAPCCPRMHKAQQNG